MPNYIYTRYLFSPISFYFNFKISIRSNITLKQLVHLFCTCTSKILLVIQCMLSKLLWLLYELFKIPIANNTEPNIYKESISVGGFFLQVFCRGSIGSISCCQLLQDGHCARCKVPVVLAATTCKTKPKWHHNYCLELKPQI